MEESEERHQVEIKGNSSNNLGNLTCQRQASIEPVNRPVICLTDSLFIYGFKINLSSDIHNLFWLDEPFI